MIRSRYILKLQEILRERNSKNTTSHNISKKDDRVRLAFEKCGLNPLAPSRVAFEEHIESLPLEGMYNAKASALNRPVLLT